MQFFSMFIWLTASTAFLATSCMEKEPELPRLSTIEEIQTPINTHCANNTMQTFNKYAGHYIFDVSHTTNAGAKPNQDKYTLEDDLVSFFLIADGNGRQGTDVAHNVCRKLKNTLLSDLKNNWTNSFYLNNYVSYPYNSVAKESIHNAFRKINDEFRLKRDIEVVDTNKKTLLCPKKTHSYLGCPNHQAFDNSGSTANLVLIEHNTQNNKDCIHTAHCGDSPIFAIYSDNTCIQLTDNHDLFNSKEEARIRSINPQYITNANPPHLLNSRTTRGFGQFSLQEYGFLVDPCIETIELTPHIKRIMITSAGASEGLSTQEISTLYQKYTDHNKFISAMLLLSSASLINKSKPVDDGHIIKNYSLIRDSILKGDLPSIKKYVKPLMEKAPDNQTIIVIDPKRKQ